MPVAPLIDLALADPARPPIADREAIAKYNPHRFEMALLDGVLWHSDDLLKGTGLWRVKPTEFWTRGHIPGEPLMPGVLMIEAGAQLASYMYYKKAALVTGAHPDWFAGFARIEDVSFRGRVVPGDDFLLLCDVHKFGLKRFAARLQGVVRGDVCFEAEVVGLAFPKLGAVERT